MEISFPFSQTDILFGFVLPTIVALTLVVGISRLFSHNTAVHTSAAPLALAAGFLTASISLGLSPLTPDSHWHWLPYAVVLTTVVGIGLSFLKARLFSQAVVILLVAGACGYFLIPTWESLEPSRSIHLVVWPLLVTIVATAGFASFDPKHHAEQIQITFVMCVVFTSTAILILLADSERFSVMSLAVAGPSVGLLVATFFKWNRGSLEGVMFPVASTLCGLLLIAMVNSFSPVPWYCYLLIPLGFVASRLARVPEFANYCGEKKWFVSAAITVAICFCSIGSAAWFVFK